jgi:hypothetical protein
MYIIRCYEKLEPNDLAPDGRMPYWPFDKKKFADLGEAKRFVDTLLDRLKEKRDSLDIQSAVIEIIDKKTNLAKYRRELLDTGQVTNSPPLV